MAVWMGKMQSTMSYVGEQAQLTAGELPNCVLANNDEIKKQASILIRLVKLLKNGGISSDAFSGIALRYGRKLQGCLDLWVIYQRIVGEESGVYGAELESVLEGDSALSVRHAIGDVGEAEYRLKKAMFDWDIENIKKKSIFVENGLSQLEGLLDLMGSEAVEEMQLLIDDDCRAIRELGLDSRVSEILLGNFNILAKIIE